MRLGLERKDWWVFVLWGAFLSNGFLITINSAASAFIATEFGLTDAEIAWTFGWIGLGSLGAYVASRYVDRFGRRRFFLVFMAGQGLLAFTSFIVPSLEGYVIAQVVLGTFAGGLIAVTNVMTTEMYGVEHRARAHSRGGFIARIGGGCVLILLSMLEYGGTSWRWVWLASATVLLFLPFARAFLPETRAFEKHAGHQRYLPAKIRDLDARLLKRFFLLCAASFLSAMAVISSMFWIFYFPIQKLGLTAAVTTLIILGGGVVGLLGFPLGSRLLNSIGRRLSLVIAGLGIMGGALVFYIAPSGDMVRSILYLTLGFILMSLSENLFLISTRTWSTELFPTRVRARVQGAMSLAAAIGAISSKFLLSMILGTLSGLTESILMLVLMMLLALGLYLMLPETWRTGMAEDIER